MSLTSTITHTTVTHLALTILLWSHASVSSRMCEEVFYLAFLPLQCHELWSMDIYNKCLHSGKKHSTTNGDKMSREHKYNLCLSMLPRKCHFRLVFVGYYSNKSAVQHVLLNWIQLRQRERERAGLIRWAAWIVPSKLVWCISQRIMNLNILLFGRLDYILGVIR